MLANQGKSRRSAGELPDIELKTRFREIGLWEEKLRRLKFDRDEDIEQKAVFEDLLDYFLKLQAVSIREQGRRKCLTRLKSAWQELAAIEAKISATTAEEKRVLEGVRTRCQDCVFALQEAAVEAERECSELEQEIGGNVEYVAYINRALDRMGMRPDCDLRPELLLAEDPVPAATEPLEHFQRRCIVDSGETLRQTGNGEMVWGRSAAQAAAGLRPWGRNTGATGQALLRERALGVEDLCPTQA